MKKTWSVPVVEDLSVKMTALSPERTGKIDAEYTDKNNNLWTSYS